MMKCKYQMNNSYDKLEKKFACTYQGIVCKTIVLCMPVTIPVDGPKLKMDPEWCLTSLATNLEKVWYSLEKCISLTELEIYFLITASVGCLSLIFKKRDRYMQDFNLPTVNNALYDFVSLNLSLSCGQRGRGFIFLSATLTTTLDRKTVSFSFSCFDSSVEFRKVSPMCLKKASMWTWDVLRSNFLISTLQKLPQDF